MLKLKVRYTCRMCALTYAVAEVEGKPEEGTLAWYGAITAGLLRDHAIRSPACASRRFRDIVILAREGEGSRGVEAPGTRVEDRSATREDVRGPY